MYCINVFNLSAPFSPGWLRFISVQWISVPPVGGQQRTVPFTGGASLYRKYTSTHLSSEALYWSHPVPQVRHIGFSTGWGSVGEFKIWRKEDSDENHNEAFTLGVPHNIVPGSERASAFMIGRLFLKILCCFVCWTLLVFTYHHIEYLVSVCTSFFRGRDGANS